MFSVLILTAPKTDAVYLSDLPIDVSYAAKNDAGEFIYFLDPETGKGKLSMPLKEAEEALIESNQRQLLPIARLLATCGNKCTIN